MTNRRSVLHYAAFDGHTECVRLLLPNNCNVDTQDDEGWTAVILASQEGHAEIVKLICQEHPELSLKSKIGRNALHSACFNGHTEIVKTLLNADGRAMLFNNHDIDGHLFTWQPKKAS